MRGNPVLTRWVDCRRPHVGGDVELYPLSLSRKSYITILLTMCEYHAHTLRILIKKLSQMVAIVARLLQSHPAILSCQAYWRLNTRDAGLAM